MYPSELTAVALSTYAFETPVTTILESVISGPLFGTALSVLSSAAWVCIRVYLNGAANGADLVQNTLIVQVVDLPCTARWRAIRIQAVLLEVLREIELIGRLIEIWIYLIQDVLYELLLSFRHCDRFSSFVVRPVSPVLSSQCAQELGIGLVLMLLEQREHFFG